MVGVRENTLSTVPQTAATGDASFTFFLHSSTAIATKIISMGESGKRRIMHHLRPDSTLAVLFRNAGTFLLGRGSRSLAVHSSHHDARGIRLSILR